MSAIGHLLIHSVDVTRPNHGFAAGTKQPVLNAPTAVVTGLVCRVNPLPPRQLEAILGRYARAKWMLVWEGGTVLKNEDLVVFNATTYLLREIQPFYAMDGATVHHNEAILEERK